MTIMCIVTGYPLPYSMPCCRSPKGEHIIDYWDIKRTNFNFLLPVLPVFVSNNVIFVPFFFFVVLCLAYFSSYTSQCN